MSYVTQAQLSERYSERKLIQLSDRSVPASGLIDGTVVARAIADTDALIDGYLMGRSTLPLSSVPALLTELASAIAWHKLHMGSVPDKVREDFDDAMKRLKEIAQGTIRLSVAGAEPAASTTGGDTVRTNAPERPFTPETMKGYI